MQHKGVSCGPLSFIHAAAACELPAWQSCRRVVWHPVDSCSHSVTIRSPRSRGGAHLHKKYMDTLLTYIRVTTHLFCAVTGSCLSLVQTQQQPFMRFRFISAGSFTLLYRIYSRSTRVCLCWLHGVIAVYIVHNVAPGPLLISHFALLATLKEGHPLHKRREQATVVLAHSASIFADMHKSSSLPAGYVHGQLSEVKKQSRSNQPRPLHGITTLPHYSFGQRACVGGGW